MPSAPSTRRSSGAVAVQGATVGSGSGSGAKPRGRGRAERRRAKTSCRAGRRSRRRLLDKVTLVCYDHTRASRKRIFLGKSVSDLVASQRTGSPLRLLGAQATARAAPLAGCRWRAGSAAQPCGAGRLSALPCRSVLLRAALGTCSARQRAADDSERQGGPGAARVEREEGASAGTLTATDGTGRAGGWMRTSARGERAGPSRRARSARRARRARRASRARDARSGCARRARDAARRARFRASASAR